ncbi:biotin transporter BioY [Acidobacteriia bacterium AH_259_A11_L15]|nr:biotin transporter BioY [Acidobacteriia bacterium AH_259_A11_L15]
MVAPRSSAVLVDALLPRLSLAQNILLVISGSVLVALCAHIALPLPFSPVPVTGQTFAVLLLGATFGARRSAAALLLYLAEGAAGLPVFAPMGLPGAARLLGPTAGYLWAYPLAAFLLGWIVARSEVSTRARRWLGLLAGVLAAEVVIFAAGMAWLKILTQASWSAATVQGLLPFLPGELAKVALLTICLPASWWAVETRKPRR